MLWPGPKNVNTGGWRAPASAEAIFKQQPLHRASFRPERSEPSRRVERDWTRALPHHEKANVMAGI